MIGGSLVSDAVKATAIDLLRRGGSAPPGEAAASRRKAKGESESPLPARKRP
jgi:hypothetical protein